MQVILPKPEAKPANPAILYGDVTSTHLESIVDKAQALVEKFFGPRTEFEVFDGLKWVPFKGLDVMRGQQFRMKTFNARGIQTSGTYFKARCTIKYPDSTGKFTIEHDPEHGVMLVYKTKHATYRTN